jgi:hypothetical protein
MGLALTHISAAIAGGPKLSTDKAASAVNSFFMGSSARLHLEESNSHSWYVHHG